MSDDELHNLEVPTRGQSIKWKDGRKLRVTSSFFGKICKAKASTSYDKIIQSIRTRFKNTTHYLRSSMRTDSSDAILSKN